MTEHMIDQLIVAMVEFVYNLLIVAIFLDITLFCQLYSAIHQLHREYFSQY